MQDSGNNKPRKKFAESEALTLLKNSREFSVPINLRNAILFLQEKYSNFNVIKSKDLENGLSGFLTKEIGHCDEEKTTIGFNANHPWVRNRFTIAHEIGCLILGHTCGEDGDSVVEKEADYFAACLLMPKELLKRDYSKTKSQKDLAHKYIVSESSMTLRLIETKILKF